MTCVSYHVTLFTLSHDALLKGMSHVTSCDTIFSSCRHPSLYTPLLFDVHPHPLWYPANSCNYYIYGSFLEALTGSMGGLWDIGGFWSCGLMQEFFNCFVGAWHAVGVLDLSVPCSRQVDGHQSGGYPIRTRPQFKDWCHAVIFFTVWPTVLIRLSQ